MRIRMCVIVGWGVGRCEDGAQKIQELNNSEHTSTTFPGFLAHQVRRSAQRDKELRAIPVSPIVSHRENERLVKRVVETLVFERSESITVLRPRIYRRPSCPVPRGDVTTLHRVACTEVHYETHHAARLDDQTCSPRLLEARIL
jgi:hypothetical protein